MNKNVGVALLVLRIALGVIFLFHGIDKFQNGIENAAGFFTSLGLASFLAYITAVIEIIGGIMMIAGLGTRVVGFLFAIIMVGAIVTVKLSLGLINGFEFELALLAMSITLVMTGSPWVSIDRLIYKLRMEDE